MNVHLKKLQNEIEVKNNGVEFGIWDTADTHLGDILCPKRLVWSGAKGRKTPKGGGKSISWEKFISWTNNL